MPLAAELPAVDQIAHQIKRVGFMAGQKVQQHFGLAVLRTQANVG